MLSWNVAGINSIFEAWTFLEKHDVLIFQETWIEEKNEKSLRKKLNGQYKWWMKSANRTESKGRAKGGQLIGIKKRIEKIQVREWEFGMVIDIECKSGRYKTIITVYNNVGVQKVTNAMEDTMEELQKRTQK